MDDRILVIDEGTSSTRAMLFDLAGQCLGVAQNALTSILRVGDDGIELFDRSAGEDAPKPLRTARAADKAAAAPRGAAPGEGFAQAERKGGGAAPIRERRSIEAPADPFAAAEAAKPAPAPAKAESSRRAKDARPRPRAGGSPDTSGCYARVPEGRPKTGDSPDCRACAPT